MLDFLINNETLIEFICAVLMIVSLGVATWTETGLSKYTSGFFGALFVVSFVVMFATVIINGLAKGF